MQTTITRDSPAVPWGFRLKGGAEYNVPLSILKVNEGSPSHFKLEVGDVIASIGSYPALSLKHEEALNIIRMFDLSLPLIIHRQQALFSPSRIAPKSGTTPVVWRPQSASSYQPPSTPKSPTAQHFSFNQPQVYQPNYLPTQPQVFRPQVYQPTPQLYQPVYPSSPPGNRLVVSPPPQSVSPIPPPPPLPDFSAPSQSYKGQRQTDASYNRISSDSSSSSANPVVPDALLNKVLSKSPMGQKPFSYTPGGLDLSHVRQSARVKRYEQMSSSQEMSRTMRQTSVGPEFGSQYQHRQPNSHYQNFNPPQATQFQTYSPPSVPAPPPPPPQPPHMQPQPTAYFQPSQAALNRSSSVSTESFVVKSPKPSAAFNLTPELLQKTKNNNAEKRDLRNQSFSFKMLNKWIADSESNTPIQLVSKKDEEENSVPKQTMMRKSEVIKALEETETKRTRQSQSPQTTVKFNPAVPSKVFQYVDRKFSESSETNSEIQNLYQKVPARERDQEPPISRYKGNHIPSKTFKYLQYITQNESQSTSTTSTSTTTSQHAEPVIQTAQVQVATSNQTKSQVSHENSYIKQQALHREIASQNTNSASFPASQPAFESTRITEQHSYHEEETSEAPEPAEQQSKPDLVLNSTKEEILVESVIESLSNPEPEQPEEPEQQIAEEEIDEEASASEEPAYDNIPESLSLSNQEVINTDIDLNQIADTISNEAAESEQGAQEQEELKDQALSQDQQVVDPQETIQSEEFVETSEF